MNETIESRTIADPLVPGLSYRIDVVPDDDEKPSGSEAYNEPTWVEAWRRDEWRFVGVIVTPLVFDGIYELEPLDDSLWGIGYGEFPGGVDPVDTDYLIERYPVPAMIRDMRAKLAKPIAEISEEMAAVAARLAETLADLTDHSDPDHAPGGECIDCADGAADS